MFCLSLLNKIQDEIIFDKKSVSLSTDSRAYSCEDVFFCLYGENFDGFNFSEQVIKKGCKIIIYRSNAENNSLKESLNNKYSDVSFIGVVDPVISLQDLARNRALQFKENGNLIIGITGSNGKTTTKEMLFSILKSVFSNKVYATKGNLNNHIGVPLTILSAPVDCEILIVEMGSNHLGEIKTLSEIACPEAGIISSIGAAHIGLFGDIETIFKEKTSLLNYVVDNKSNRSVFVLNNEDQYLNRIEETSIVKKFGNNCEYTSNIKVNNSSLTKSNKLFEIKNQNIKEIYNLQNLISTFILSIELFPQYETEFLDAVNIFSMPKLNRSEWIEKKSKLIFLDAYNANPTSMRASLNSFVENVKSKGLSLSDVHFVLGDMNELGDFTQTEHESIGQLLVKLGAKSASFVGNYSAYYKNSFKSGNVYSSRELLVDAWPTIYKEHRAFFIKASRSLQLESLIDIT